MSTFPGQINEIPGISVDRFDGANSTSSVYFLSHCHTDHMQGLSLNFFQTLTESDKHLYCSPISREFLLGIYPGSPEDRITEIELGIPKTIVYKVLTSGEESPETSLTVTTSPAGHCPGSVMFVFNKGEKSVLYTGDFRVNTEDLRKLNPLNDRIEGENRGKKFDVVYLDTTFLSYDFPSFPTREESCREVSLAVKRWLDSDDKNAVILECSASYGAEYLFVEIYKLLKTKVHVKDKVYSNYTRIAELAECATDDGSGARIHACKSKLYNGEKLPCRTDVEPENILTIVPSVQRWKGKSLGRFTEFDSGNRRRLYVCYSMHASCDELRAFVDYFKPDNIVPCVCPSESRNDIYRLLRELMSYRRESNTDDTVCEEFQLAVPILGKISSENFESVYFADDDDDDDDDY